MSYFHSDETRKSSVPNAEVFYANKGDLNSMDYDDEGDSPAGYYYWFCFPGCIPDGDAMGPYNSTHEAIKACRDDA